jgi:hypothetical protein
MAVIPNTPSPDSVLALAFSQLAEVSSSCLVAYHAALLDMPPTRNPNREAAWRKARKLHTIATELTDPLARVGRP